MIKTKVLQSFRQCEINRIDKLLLEEIHFNAGRTIQRSQGN